MSLLWRDRMQVFLGADQVNLVGVTRGIKPVQRFRQSDICVQANDPKPWKASLQCLELMLGQVDDGFRRGARLHVALSNHFVRYGVIAPQPSLSNPEELMAYADFQMREIYGERVDDWVLSLSTWDPCGGALCAAIAHDLQSELESLARRCGTRLASIEPYLAAALDHWAKQLTGRQVWFVLVEPGRFCLVSLQDGIWRGVRNQRIVENLQEELLSALEQESVISGVNQPAGQVYVFAPEYSGQWPGRDSRWQFVRLPDHARSVPAHFPWVKGTSNLNDRQDHA